MDFFIRIALKNGEKHVGYYGKYDQEVYELDTVKGRKVFAMKDIEKAYSVVDGSILVSIRDGKQTNEDWRSLGSPA
jgi:hypothetical protein